MRRRLATTLFAIAIAAGVSGCDPLDTAEIEASEASTETASTEIAFSRDMVRAAGITKERQGGQANIRFVAGTVDFELVEILARECVEEFLTEYRGAFCYAYATDGDYGVRASDWTPDSDEGIASAYRPCFVLQAGQALALDEITITVEQDAFNHELLECPSGVEFPH